MVKLQFSIFTFSSASDMKFYTRSCSSFCLMIIRMENLQTDDVTLWHSIVYPIRMRPQGFKSLLNAPIASWELMLCAPSNRQRPFSYHTKMADFELFSCFVHFLVKIIDITQKSVLNLASDDSQIDKPQRGALSCRV